MTQRDYVSRGRANPSKSKKASNSKTPRKSSQARDKQEHNTHSVGLWLRLGGVCIVLVAFAYFLWSIKDNAPKPDNSLPTQPLVQSDEEELPELPEEEWEYIKSLPGYEVEVDLTEQEKSDKRYLMQCASFRTRAQADEMRAKIVFQGYEAQIRNSSGANGSWFRVILGPFESKRDAERTRHALRKSNITTCQIWFWNL